MALTVYNTLARAFQPLTPTEGAGKALTMYCCGPTAYGPMHIGNARSMVVFDMVHRYLESQGYALRYVQNITDVDDKIIDRAKEDGTTWKEVSERFTAAIREDAARLRVLPPDVQSLATEHIPQMIALIEQLERKGMAYGGKDRDVYYSVEARGAEYGKLSGRKLEDLQAGSRIEVDSRKRHPMDFVLWKMSKPGEPSWPSPWGEGRPGWHIECSAMAMTHLGETMDIHGAGSDIMFPHNENEIAQSEPVTGKPFARYWMHNGMLEFQGAKMSKSIGNVTLVRQLLDKFEPQVIRHFLLSAHYRSPLDYAPGSLPQSQQAVSELANTMWRLHELCSHVSSETGTRTFPLGERAKLAEQKFHEAMHRDFNTAEAMGHLFSLAGEAKQVIAAPTVGLMGDLQHALKMVFTVLFSCAAVLGLEPELGGFSTEVWQLIKNREDARKRKDFSAADQIRRALLGQGVVLEDTPSGTIPLRGGRT